jgi:hypothetical protein
MPRLGTGRTKPADLLRTLDDFESRRIDFRAFLDRSEAQIGDLASQPALDIDELEDLWTELEVVYAIAANECSETLGTSEQTQVYAVVARMRAVLEKA